MADVRQLDEARRKRDARKGHTRPPDGYVEFWREGGKSDGLRFIVEDVDATPVHTNQQRADILFDLLWDGTGDDTPSDRSTIGDRVIYIAYLAAEGQQWTRISDEALTGRVNYRHGLWHLRCAWALVKPLLVVALAATLKPYRKGLLRRWAWLQARYTD